MNRSRRNIRALRMLMLIGLLAWFGRAYWWDPYVDLTEEKRPQRRWSQRARPEPHRSLDLELPGLARLGFEDENVLVTVSMVDSERSDIRITEIHYHPNSFAEEEEFLELTNTGAKPVSLSDWEFHRGIDFILCGVINSDSVESENSLLTDFSVSHAQIHLGVSDTSRWLP